MSVDNKELNLIIKANNQSKQTMTDVATSIKELNALTLQQAEASKKGKVGIDELKATLLQLQQAQSTLIANNSLVTNFENAGIAAEKASARVTKAQAALEKYQNSKSGVDKDGTASEARAEKLARLNASVERAIVNEQKRAATYEKLKTSLAEVGIAETNLAANDALLKQSAADLGLSIGKANENIKNYSTNLRAAKQAEADLAAQQKASAAQAAAKQNISTTLSGVHSSNQNAIAAALAQRQQEQARIAAEAAAQAAKRVQDKSSVTGQADDAVRMARQFTTLAGSAMDAQPKITGLFNTIRGITDPAAQARTSLSGLEGQVAKMSQTVAAITGPVRDYHTQLNALNATQKAIGNQGALIDGWRTQMQTLNATRAAFTAARNDVMQLANAMRQADAPTAEMTEQMRVAQSRLNIASSAMRNMVTSTREMRTALNNAGIDTRNLADAEARLTTAARTNVQTLQQLSTAFRDNGNAAEGAAGKVKLFGDSGRTTLSVFQRIRGEILSLTASYIGLQGAISGAKEVIEASVQKQAIQNRLGVVVGTDKEKIGAEYDYVHGQAMRLGMGINELAGSYSKFAIDAKNSNLNLEQTKYTFERLTEVMRVNHASAEGVSGAFTQFGQMLAKGKVQMDDLKQAANWLPGLRGTMAKGLAEIGYAGISKENASADMFKIMKAGGIDAGVALHAVAVQMEKDYAEQLPEALKSLQAEQGRFNTTLFDFKQMVSDAGFGAAYTEFLKHLTENMSGDKGAEFAENLSSALTKALDIMTLIIDNADLIGTALMVAFTAKGAASVARFASAVFTNWPLIMAKIAEMNTALGTGMTRLAKLQAGVGLLGAAMIGLEIGKYLNDNFESAQQAGVYMVEAIVRSLHMLRDSIKLAGAELQDMFTMSSDGLTQQMDYEEKLSKWQREAPGPLMQYVAPSYEENWKKEKPVPPKPGDENKLVAPSASAKVIQEIRDSKAADDKIFADMHAQATANFKPKPKKVDPNDTKTTPKGESPKSTLGANEDDKAANKRANSIQSVENQLGSMEAKLERGENETLASRLKAFEDQYTGLMAKIKKIGGAEGSALQGRANSLMAGLRKQETAKYEEEVQKMHESLLSKIDQSNVKSSTRFEDVLAAKLQKIRNQYAAMKSDLDKYEHKVAGSNMSPTEKAASRAETGAMRVNLGIAQTNAETKATDQSKDEASKSRMKEINELLAERKARLEDIKLAERAGEISPSESYKQQQAVIDEMQPKIEAMAKAAREYAAAIGLAPAKLQTLNANLKLATSSGKGLANSLYSVKDANADISAGATSLFKGFAKGLAQQEEGYSRLTSGIRAAGRAFAQFVADFLMKIAEMIIQQQILNALQSMGGGGGGGGLGGMLSSAVGAGVHHAGGTVGSNVTTRSANVNWFVNAPRYHTGGIAGLSADEYPSILKKNEEVLTTDDPRNILNSGRNTQTAAVPMSVKIVNAIDSSAMVKEGLSTTVGEKAIMNMMRTQKTQIKAILG